ncbi:hypothetical protein GHK86_05500 [Acidimicrobiaceae bacterium USS-CC1]|uniref:Amino acid permease n=1 Tax=Acidiferrimicrobium australe TaxID=2664430 RepID=A0ABW9QRT5_9ACTN|nr:hypothetical protein [Acidiferrimicrobium australe]
MGRRTGIVVNAFAVVYGAVMTVNLVWPRASFYGPAWYQQYAAVAFVPAVIIIGIVYYRTRLQTTPTAGTANLSADYTPQPSTGQL